MAFHYQNLIQEKDYIYPEFEKQYSILKKYADKKLSAFRKAHLHPKMKDIWSLAVRSCVKEGHLSKEEVVTFPRRQERILIITNILFPDDEDFLNTLKAGYQITRELCENLKNVLNELNRADGDFLDSTMEGLVRYHIPSFDIIRADLNLNVGDEFIIWKLMEIMYLHNDIFEKIYPNEKSL